MWDWIMRTLARTTPIEDHRTRRDYLLYRTRYGLDTPEPGAYGAVPAPVPTVWDSSGWDLQD